MNADCALELKSCTLRTMGSRQDGAVTVGDSRVTVVGVLDVIWARGVAEAAVMWPLLTADELAVLELLATEIETRERKRRANGYRQGMRMGAWRARR